MAKRVQFYATLGTVVLLVSLLFRPFLPLHDPARSRHPRPLAVPRLCDNLVGDGHVLSNLEVEHSHHAEVGAARERVLEPGPWVNGTRREDLVGEPRAL